MPDRPLYAVMGNPVHHSKSPAIHTQFARQCGITLEYRAIEVELGRFADAAKEFFSADGNGLNITVPFKLDAYGLAGKRSTRANLAGAVNTLKLEADGTLYGDNTDGVGLVRDLIDNCGVTLKGRRILVVGAGGAVRGILGPLLQEGVDSLVVANRTVSKAMELEKIFSTHGSIRGCGFDDLQRQRFDVVINGTSASVQAQIPPLPAELFAREAIAYDLMYGDKPLPFMTWAQQHGAARVSDGLGMLVEQAAESFFVWHAARPQTAPVIEALRAAGSQGQ